MEVIKTLLIAMGGFFMMIFLLFLVEWEAGITKAYIVGLLFTMLGTLVLFIVAYFGFRFFDPEHKQRRMLIDDMKKKEYNY